MEPRTRTYCVNMPPIPWARARLAGKKFFNKQAKEKLTFGLYLRNQHKDEPVFNKPVSIDITFYMKQPKDWSLKKKESTVFHGVKPDLDNLCKFILDAMKGVLIQDDNIICSMHAKKVYDENPRTEFIITENI